jgi:hypothetical protein
MERAYLWKTKFLLLDDVINERYNFRIYKNREYIQRLHIGIDSFLKEFLDTVHEEGIYLKGDVNFRPPPRFRSAKEVKKECPLTENDIKKIFNAWL